MNNVSLAPGEGTLDDLVADTADGVLLLTNRSWSIDDRRLDFSFGCEVAYEVQGRPARPAVPQPDVRRPHTRLLGAPATRWARDCAVWGVPNCGKGQPMQVARVGHGAPTARFRATVGVR